MTVVAPWGWNMSSWHSLWGCWMPTWLTPNKQPGSGELSQLVSRLELVSLVVNILHVLSHIIAGRIRDTHVTPLCKLQESRAARCATVYGVAKSWTWLSNWTPSDNDKVWLHWERTLRSLWLASLGLCHTSLIPTPVLISILSLWSTITMSITAFLSPVNHWAWGWPWDLWHSLSIWEIYKLELSQTPV